MDALINDTSLALIQRIFGVVFPLAAIAAVGFLYARKRPTDMAVANRINIDVFIPALIFSVMAASDFRLLDYVPLGLGAVVVVLGSALVAWPFCRWLGVAPKTLLPPMMFNNSGNLGIPLLVLAFGEAALPAAIVMFVISNLLHPPRASTFWRVTVGRFRPCACPSSSPPSRALSGASGACPSPNRFSSPLKCCDRYPFHSCCLHWVCA